MPRPPRPQEWGYGVTLLAVALATLARLMIDPVVGDRQPFFTYYLALVVAAWVGGLGPSILALALGAFSGAYFFFNPFRSAMIVDASDWVALAIFLIVGITIIVFGEGQRAARRRLEREMAERGRAEATLRAYYDSAPVCMGIVEPTAEGDILHIDDNPATCRFFGTEPGGTRDRLASELGVEPDLVSLWTAKYRESERTGTPIHFDHPLATPAGRRWLSVTVNVIGPGPSRRTRFCYVAEDVTERKRAEEALRQSERQLALVIDTAPVMIAHCDREGRYRFVNRAYAERFGMTARELVGKNIAEILGETVYALAAPRIAEVLAGRMAEYEAEIECFGRGPRRLHALYAPEVDADGEVQGYVAVVNDITERKRAEAELERSRRLFERIAQATPDLLYVDDVERERNVYRNRSVAELLGYAVEEMAPLGAFQQTDLAHPDDRVSPADVLAGVHALADGEVFDHTVRVRGADGAYRWLRCREVVFERAPDGRVRQLLGVARDVTEQLQIEQSLRDADRRKDDFLATLAHELRNPLAPIRHAVALMRALGDPDPELEYVRDVIDRQVGNMAHLLDDLLEISRITRNKLELRRERVDLASVIQVAVETSRPLIEDGGHELTVRLPPEPIALDADPTRLAQVFANLLNNAAKYSDHGGRIALHAERRDGQVVVSVDDTGIGIDADHLARIFEMFSQAQPALERSQGGLGIGLSLVRGLVELHGGTVEARSDGPGTGSTFQVRLPVATAPAAGPSTPAAAPTPTPTVAEGDTRDAGWALRVLVVDDNLDSARTLGRLLERAGHEVHLAHDGPSALKAAEAFEPGVIVLDIGLPGMDGYEVARQVRQRPGMAEAHLIALTGWGQRQDRARSRDAGFDHHIVKPADPVELLALIRGTATRAAPARR